jgi:hypothetical protein
MKFTVQRNLFINDLNSVFKGSFFKGPDSDFERDQAGPDGN